MITYDCGSNIKVLFLNFKKKSKSQKIEKWEILNTLYKLGWVYLDN